jgi:hypothetical protein
MMDNFHEVESAERRERRRPAHWCRKRQQKLEQEKRKKKTKARARAKAINVEVNTEVMDESKYEIEYESEEQMAVTRPGYVIDEFSGEERRRTLMDDFREIESKEKTTLRHLHHWERQEKELREELLSKSASLRRKGMLRKNLQAQIKQAQRKAEEARVLLEEYKGEYFDDH